jgi:hypothetical protein
MNAPGYRNPKAQVDHAFSSLLRKSERLKSLARVDSSFFFGEVRPTKSSPQLEAQYAAMEEALGELGNLVAEASRDEQFEPEVLQIIEVHTGLKVGDICRFPGRRPFQLERAWLHKREDWHYKEAPELLLCGTALRKDGTPYVRGSTECFMCTDLDEVRETLGMPPLPAPAYSGKDPSEMSQDELLDDIQAQLGEHRWIPEPLRHVDSLIHDVFWMSKEVRENKLNRSFWSEEGDTLHLTLDVNSKGNLWIHCARPPRPQPGSRFASNHLWHLWQSKQGDLTIHDFESLMRGIEYPEERVPSIRFPKEVQCARMHSLLVYAVEKAVNGYIDMLRNKFDVTWTGARVVVKTSPGKLPYLAIAFRCTDHDWNPHPVVALTDLSESTLLGAIDRLHWRNPSAGEAARWAGDVIAAGGDDVTSKPNWLSHVIDFYREHDPETIAQREAEKAARELARQKAHEAKVAAERAIDEDAVRALLGTTEIGHGTGWREAVAKAAGIPVQKVKPWLKRRMPLEFEKLYPNGRARAKRSSTSKG